MTRTEKNEAIAKILGFKKGSIKHKTENGEVYQTITGWQYPPEYQNEVSGSPMFYCPDFIGILEKYRAISEIQHNKMPCFPMDYDSKLIEKP